MKLDWGCSFEGGCERNGDALRGLCDMLGHDADCCGDQGLDPQGVLERDLEVECALPRPTLECFPGTVDSYALVTAQKIGGFVELVATDTGSRWTIVPRPDHRGPGRLNRSWSVAEEVIACGIPLPGQKLYTKLIVVLPAEGPPFPWLSLLKDGQHYWLSGRGEVLQELLLPQSGQAGSSVPLISDELGEERALFIWRDRESRYVHISKVGK
jgi:hypothetical protein